jgi:enoyl-CoA hydratase/carnithine racemase
MEKLPQLTDCLISEQDRIVTLTFNRVEVRNALTGTAIASDIVATIDWINKNEEIAVLIITGQGSAFSSGGNVKDMAEKTGDFDGSVATLEHKYRQGIQAIPLAIQKAEVPVIAAINGPAIGAGFDVANMCDMRIASTKAKFGETFANIGLIPGDGGAWFLQRLIGYQKAAELTFSGRIIEAQEAMDMGLLLAVVEPDKLMPRVMKLAQDIAAKPTAALRKTKRLMKLAQRTELADFLDICAAFQGMCHQDPAHLEAVNRLLDKISSSGRAQ